jgi:hypothetical protein
MDVSVLRGLLQFIIPIFSSYHLCNNNGIEIMTLWVMRTASSMMDVELAIFIIINATL